MPIMQVVSSATVTHRGPEVWHDATDSWVDVHLRQGSLDGACGPYCVFMGLILAGVLHPDDISYGLAKRSTRVGKLQAAMLQSSGLFGDGTSIKELADAIENSFGKVVDVEYSTERGAKLRPFVFDHLANDRPVILGLLGKSIAHWVLAVGLEYESQEEFEARKPQTILALDPGLPTPRVAAWNQIIAGAAVSRGRYPYCLWPEHPEGEVTPVQLDMALSIVPR